MKNYKAYTPYTIKDIELKNRIVMPPMCMYSAKDDGKVTDFHMTHYTARALGQVGLIIVEATGVMPNGRISDHDLGLWDESQVEGMKKLVSQIKSYGSVAAIQLNHGGRKYEGVERKVGPSAIAFDENYQVPNELTIEEINEIVEAFGYSAKLAYESGFDAIEIHGAHGYLINQFLSPHSNKRVDAYGGSPENRVRFLKEVIAAIKAYWPGEKPLLLRISATEYLEDGYDETEMVEMLNMVKDQLDIIHVSSGGNGKFAFSVYPGYQVKQSENIRKGVGLPTIAVGLLDDLKLIEEVLGNERADLVAVGRELLVNPNFVIHEALKNGIDIKVPLQYERAYRK